MEKRTALPIYVLVTPSRNEAAFIEKTLESVVRQTVLPAKWVIVNDGSTDETGTAAAKYAEKYPWIEVVNLPVRSERNFAAKVNAFNAGQERLKSVDYDLIGNLDSDVSLDEDHFEFLLLKFEDDARLGVAGTVFKEESGYNSATDSSEGQLHVSGQCQLFRRQCFEEIGGYFANKAGGIDWIAVTTARMKGWKTRSFREKSFFHHRHLGTAERSVFAAAFSYGEKDYFPRRTSDLGTFSRRFSDAQTSVLHRRVCSGSGLWMGSATQTTTPDFQGTHGFPSPRTDEEAQGYFQVYPYLQTD